MNLFQKIAIQGIQKIRLNKAVFRLCSRHQYLSADSAHVQEARDLLEKFAPNPKTSCKAQNELRPIADVQVIVPAYNVEKYIRECLDSVVKAKKKYSYLLTVVNDGSTDGTADVLKEYSSVPEVEIITQKNRGFSGARNAALKILKGKYIFFLDSDDFLSWEGIEALLDVAFRENAEVVEGSFVRIGEKGMKLKRFKRKNGRLNPRNELWGMPWGKVIKAELLSEMCFPERYWFEDSLFSQILYPRVKSAFGVSENVYFYRRQKKSISRTSKKQFKAIDSFWITERLHSEREQFGLIKDQGYYEYILGMAKLTFRRTMSFPKDVKEAIFIVFSDFLTKNFPDFKTVKKNNQILENAIKTHDFGYYQAAAVWL